MSTTTAIDYLDAMWPVVTGCSAVSPACRHCYAARLAATRLKHHPRYKGLAASQDGGYRWTGEVRCHADPLDQPLRWRKPRTIGVAFTGDLFHPLVPDKFLDSVFAVMAISGQHRFLLLTKRPERMRDYILADRMGFVEGHAKRTLRQMSGDPTKPVLVGKTLGGTWPWDTVYLGVTAEDQQRADERIPLLLATPAAKRFVSLEPMLGAVDLGHFLCKEWSDRRPMLGMYLDWVIAGGESGPGARPLHPQWARDIRDQCAAAGVPFFFKQWGGYLPRSQADDLLAVFNPAPKRYRDDGTPADAFAPVQGDVIEYWARLGKRAAGHLLDGREHRELPW